MDSHHSENQYQRWIRFYNFKIEGDIMKTTNYFALLIFFVILGIGVGITYVIYGAHANTEGTVIDVISFFIALIVACSIKVADQWEKAVVLRLGGFHSLRGTRIVFYCTGH